MDTDHFADLGIVSESFDAESAFQRIMQIRTACRKACAKEDCSTRVAKALIHKSAPIPMDYSVGTLRLLLPRG